MTSPKFVKQHGMQRTGTNYVRALIEDNWDTKVLVNVLGWKHGVPWRSWEEWIRAHRAKNGKVRAHVGGQRYDRTSVGSEELAPEVRGGRIPVIVVIRDPWYSIPRQMRIRPGTHGHEISNLCRDWNRNYRAWCRIGRVVRYEDLRAEGPEALHRVMVALGLPLLDSITDCETQCLPSSDFNSRRKGRLQSKQSPELTRWERSVIRDVLDWDFFEGFGYRRG